MAVALPIIAVAGAAASIYSSVQSGAATARSNNAQAAASNYNAEVAQNNAAFASEENQHQAQINADQSEISGQQTESQVTSLQDRNNQILGAQRATAAGNGVTLSGTFNDLAASTTAAGEMDARNALYSGKLRQWQSAVKTQADQISTFQTANNLQDTSQLDRMQAANYADAASTASTNTIFSAIGAAAGGAANVYGAVNSYSGGNVAPIFHM